MFVLHTIHFRIQLPDDTCFRKFEISFRSFRMCGYVCVRIGRDFSGFFFFSFSSVSFVYIYFFGIVFQRKM